MLPPHGSLPVFQTRRGPNSVSNAGGSAVSNDLRKTTAVILKSQKRRGTQRLFFVALALITVCYFVSVQVIEFRFTTLTKQGGLDTVTVRDRTTKGSPQNHFYPYGHLRNLIIVACHAVFIGFDYTKPEDPKHWYLLSYQTNPKYSESFIAHIQMGIVEAAADSSALLLFSGGQTRKAAGPRSEGESYWLVADAAGWYGKKEVRERAFTEEHARDSFENLEFSLCRFMELTGRPPVTVTVIGYDFKRARYETLHRAALGLPLERFQYIGTPALTEGAEQGEAQTVKAFQEDPFGCGGELLKKKEDRDPFAVGPYSNSRCPALEPWLDFCSTRQLPPQLPWDIADDGVF